MSIQAPASQDAAPSPIAAESPADGDAPTDGEPPAKRPARSAEAPALGSPVTPARPAPAARPACASVVETVNLVFPEDANPKGTIFGGRVLQWVDMVGAMAAQRHCRQIVVTAVMDAVVFRAPIYVGEYAVAKAWVNRAWRSSMEVQVRVEAEAPLTGERRLSTEAFLTFVAVDAQDRPTLVPPLMPETPEEQERFEAAERRRAARMAFRPG